MRIDWESPDMSEMTRTEIGKGKDNSGTKMPPVTMTGLPKDNGAIGTTIKEEPENGTTTIEGIRTAMITETETMMIGGHTINKMLTIWGVPTETLQTDGIIIGIKPGISEIRIPEPKETPGITQGTGMKISVTEIEEPTGIPETTPKIDGMTAEMKPGELTETKTDGTTTEIELEMLEPEHIETQRIMFGMTPMSALEILLEPHTDIIMKMLRIGGTTPRTEQDALKETFVITLKTDGKMLRTALRMLEIESGKLIDEQETMLLTHGKIPRIPPLISGRTAKIMLQTNGIPSSIRPATYMKVQRTVPTTLPRALGIDGTTTDAIQTRIIIDL
jgi:hypothetical protein